MTVSSSYGLGTNYGFNPLSNSSSTTGVNSGEMPEPPSDFPGEEGDTTSISTEAEQMYNLQNLATTDSETFKSVTSQISSDLTAKAQSETDSQKAQFLTEMADRFAAASESGSADSLASQTSDDSSSTGRSQGYPGGGMGGMGGMGGGPGGMGGMGGMGGGPGGGGPNGGGMSDVSSIISSAMSSVTSSSSSTSTSATSTVASTTSASSTVASTTSVTA